MKWSDYKKDFPLSDDEKQMLESLSFLVSKRKELGVSQVELAKRTGIKQSQIARIEKLEITPTMKTLSRYAKALGLVIHISFEEQDFESNEQTVSYG